MIVFSLGFFDSHLQSILHDLKYNSLKPLAATIAEKMADLIAPHLDSLGIDMILPVPLHESRLCHRGFNQSEEIAKALGRRLAIPVHPEIIYAARKTKQQARLPADQREANVRGAYGIDDPTGLIRGKSILLIDDVPLRGLLCARTNES